MIAPTKYHPPPFHSPRALLHTPSSALSRPEVRLRSHGGQRASWPQGVGPCLPVSKAVMTRQ